MAGVVLVLMAATYRWYPPSKPHDFNALVRRLGAGALVFVYLGAIEWGTSLHAYAAAGLLSAYLFLIPSRRTQ